MRPIDADALMENYNLIDATKYGNRDAKQQEHSYSTMMMYEIADMIEDAPTIDLPGKWIPCSERTPEFKIYSVKKLWVTMHRKGRDFRFVRQLRWNGYQGVWEWENGKTISDEWEIIAWKPLYIPEPYKEE